MKHVSGALILFCYEFLQEGKELEPFHIIHVHNFKMIMDSCEEYARRWAKKEDVKIHPRVNFYIEFTD